MADELDQHALSRDEVLARIRDALYTGDERAVMAAVNSALSRDIAPRDVLSKGLIGGVDGIDRQFGVAEATPMDTAVQAGVAALRPHFTPRSEPPIGTIVIGTVKGNGCDLRKDLVVMMLQDAGFAVHDIGTNNATDDYVNAVETYRPDILGVRALQTWTIPYIRVVIEALRKEGLGEDLIVLGGGATLEAASTDKVGADVYCRGVMETVEAAKRLIGLRTNAPG